MNYDQDAPIWCVFCGLSFLPRYLKKCIASAPRSPEFRRKVAEWKDETGGGNSEPCFGELDFLDDDVRSTYDGELVNDENTAWMKDGYSIGPYYRPDDAARPPARVTQELVGADFGTVGYHKACCEILAFVMYGSPSATGKIDQMICYRTVEALITPGVVGPRLDYGVFTTYLNNEFWPHAGEEFLVVDPSFRSSQPLKDLIRSRLQVGTFYLRPASADADGPRKRLRRDTVDAGSDPFHRLPYDILHAITSRLDYACVYSLMIASRAVNAQLSRSSSFWRQWLLRTMPWLVEARELFSEEPQLLENKDFKRLYLWLEKETKIRRFADGPFLPAVNRKRVWQVCEQLAGEWLDQGVTGPRFNLQQILTHSVTIGPGANEKPVYPDPGYEIIEKREDVQHSNGWLKSWSDIDNLEKKILTCWSDDMRLAGVTMVVHGKRRGEWQPDKYDYKRRDDFVVAPGDWVIGLVVHMTPDDGSRTYAACQTVGLTPDTRLHAFVHNEPLVWGQTKQELESLISITAYVVKGPAMRHDDKGSKTKKVWINEVEILGLTVEFSPESSIAPRTVGLRENPLTGKPWTKAFTRTLEIDGKGGERISEVHWFCDGFRESTRATPGQPWRGVRILTNKGQEALWCNAAQNADNTRTMERWMRYKPEEGDVLVGLVTVFEDPCDDTAKSFKEQIPLPPKLSLLAAMALPLKELTSAVASLPLTRKKSLFRPLNQYTSSN
ncbi:hypothetical protein OQA88_9930 [Cercophora sp. LCS_1]